MKKFILPLLFAVVACTSTQTKENTDAVVETEQVANLEEVVIFDVVVEGLTDADSEVKIANSVESLESVEWAKANVSEAKVAVALKNANVDTAAVRTAITEAGFKVVSIAQQIAVELVEAADSIN